MSRTTTPQERPPTVYQQVSRRVDFVLADHDGGKVVIDIADVPTRARIQARALAFAATWLRRNGDRHAAAALELEAGAHALLNPTEADDAFDGPEDDRTRTRIDLGRTRFRPTRFRNRPRTR